ncbi:N-acetylmuramoyl-L-alanine amidase [bacterium]|nr:N-acetylmuramoyl-L-alanine amidase [bacterium]
MLFQGAFAKDLFKITSVNFDTSNFMMYISSPDNTTEPILNKIKLVKLSNPSRVYFDINSAVLQSGAQNWYFNSGDITQVKINQYSSSANTVRVVFYLKNGFDYKKIAFLKFNNNIIIRLKNVAPKNDYFEELYRDQGYMNGDFVETTQISDSDLTNTNSSNSSQDKVMQQIQNAFSTSSNQATQTTNNLHNKNLKLLSRTFINSAESTSTGFLVRSAGPLCVQKPVVQSNPTRVTFDLPNATLDSSLDNKDFVVSKAETANIQKYSVNKVRLVITSSNADKYIPLYSADAQSVLFVNPDKISINSLFSHYTNTLDYRYKSIDSKTDEFAISFDSQVVQSIKRLDGMLKIYFYNAKLNNKSDFRNEINGTTMSKITLEELNKGGLVLNVPLQKDSQAETFISADGRIVKVLISGTKFSVSSKKSDNNVSRESSVNSHRTIRKVYINSAIKKEPVEHSIELPAVPVVRRSGRKVVVLDAGHGGSDYGAIRAGINEKDINLDVTKRIEAILRSKGITVYMTRSNDTFVSLQDRTIITAAKNPDIFVSIHVNSCAGTSATGLETHYYHESSIPLAKVVHASLTHYIKSPDRGLLKNRFYVINHTNIPSILVEIGFISNDRERAEMVGSARKNQTARAVAEGIIKYLNGER